MYMMDNVDIRWYFIAGLYNMCVQVYEFIAGGKARRQCYILNYCNIYIYMYSQYCYIFVVLLHIYNTDTYSQYCYMFVVLLHECVIMMRGGKCIGKRICDNVLKYGVSTQAHE